MPHDNIRYTKNGDVHIAYEVLGSGGVDVVCHARPHHEYVPPNRLAPGNRRRNLPVP